MATKKKKTDDEDIISCTIRELPKELRIAAAETAFSENPANRPDPMRVLAFLGAHDDVADLPDHMAFLSTKFWGNKGAKLGVAFMDTQDSTLKNKILAYMNLWNANPQYPVNVEFKEASLGMAQIRIARQSSGYWSFLGVDALHIPVNEPTMNFQGFTVSTSESEYMRVVPHEAAHGLGAVHEHARAEIIKKLDFEMVIAEFSRSQGWSREEVIQQILTPIPESRLLASSTTDEDSIMTYTFSGRVTKDRKPIVGGSKITQNDYAQMSKVYPKSVVQPPPPPISNGWVLTIKGKGDKPEIVVS
jgi:hypothetical protein